MAKKNMLILQLSTGVFGGKTKYLTPEGGEPLETNGYQLEPVPRYLAKKIGIDQVLMITTNETEPIEADFRKTLLEMENRHTLTPDDIKEYPLDKDVSTIQDVEAIIKIIQEYVNKNPHSVELYLDIHGGPRVNAEMMTSIFSLLPRENIDHGQDGHSDIEHIRIDSNNIYSVAFDRNDKGEIPQKNKIFHAGENYELLNFVSGVHEFVEYGRAESLKKYADTHPALMDVSNKMGAIADALAMGDISAFETGVNDLNNCLENNANQSEETIGLLYRLIRQEYKGILNDADVRDQIMWSVDKQFYQLAMTMCESKMIPFLEGRLGTAGGQTENNAMHVLDWHEIHGTDPDKIDTRINSYINNFDTRIIGEISFYYLRAPKPGLFGDDANKVYFVFCRNGYDNEAVNIFLNNHRKIKATRNKANHAGDFKEEKVYKNVNELREAITAYIKNIDIMINNQVQLPMYYIEKSDTYESVRNRYPNIHNGLPETAFNRFKETIWSSVAEEMKTLADYLESHDSIHETDTVGINNTKLIEIYRALCKACGDNRPEKRAAAVRNTAGAELLVELYKADRMNCNGVVNEDKDWLTTDVLKDGTNKKPQKKFWKKAADVLKKCSNIEKVREMLME